MRIFLWKMGNLCLLCCILFGYQNISGKRSRQINAYEKKVKQAKEEVQAGETVNSPGAEKGTRYEDGVYEGSGKGFGGEIEVQVVVQDGSIQSVKILSAKEETPEYLKSARALLDTVVQEQTPDVDTVSGATLSSNGILEGIRQALKQA